MRDDTQVRPDDLHVYPVLLISDDHRPPQTARTVALLAARTLRTGHRSVVWKTTQSAFHLQIRFFFPVKTSRPLTSDWPSHSSSLPLLREPSESSSGVSMSSTFMSRSSGVSRKSSESSEPSLLSSDRLISGAISVRRFCRTDSVWSAVRAAWWADRKKSHTLRKWNTFIKRSCQTSKRSSHTFWQLQYQPSIRLFTLYH